MRIKVIFTGGTIGSELCGSNISVNTGGAVQKQLISTFFETTGRTDIQFDVSEPFSILSENMSIQHWNTLLDEFRKTNFSDYDGIILAHGTDTLAYTSNMLSIMLSGIEIPVVLVSSNYVLTDKRANGNDNFLNAVNFISEKKFSGIYAIYKNNSGKSVVYLGSRLKQCSVITNEFSSTHGINFGEMKNNRFYPIECPENPLPTQIISIPTQELILNKIPDLKPCVMLIIPYTGIDYNNYSPTSATKAVLHCLYHGGTAPTASAENQCGSIIEFMEKCKRQGIEVYISSLESENSEKYSTTADIISAGANAFYNLSPEMAYSKLITAYSTDDEQLCKRILYDNLFFENTIF